MTKFNAKNHKASKLTGEQVIEIRQKYSLPGRQYTQDRLAREYQVSSNTIRNIVNGVTWQSLPVLRTEGEERTEAKLSELRMIDALRGTLPPAASEAPPEIPEILKPRKENPYE